jgi:general secretion pathway protein C
MKRWPLLTSFVLFIALCASAAYWVMQLYKPPVRMVVAAPAPVAPPPDPRAAVALFGGRQGPVTVATNYQLRGVVASGTGGESVAILAVEGKPPQAVRANREIQPGVLIKEVHPRYVLLQENGVIKRVDLPEDTKGMGLPDSGSRPPVARAVPPLPASMPQVQSMPQAPPQPIPQPQAGVVPPPQVGVVPGQQGNMTPNFGSPMSGVRR